MTTREKTALDELPECLRPRDRRTEEAEDTMMIRVTVESPYAGDVEANVAYAKRCVLDCLARKEAPYASHLFFPQPGLLDDSDPVQRELGIRAGLAWQRSAGVVAIYVDRGISEGMRQGIRAASERGAHIEVRTLDREVTKDDLLLVNREAADAWRGRAIAMTTNEEQRGTGPHARIETQATISTWADDTFGPSGSNARGAARANEEMAELLGILTVDDASPKAAAEIADVLIVLYRLATRLGVDLHAEVDRKMAVNRAREWKRDGSGHGYHVRGDR